MDFTGFLSIFEARTSEVLKTSEVLASKPTCRAVFSPNLAQSPGDLS